MTRSFEDWFNGKEEEKPEVKEPEKFYDYDDELPHDVDFADEPGHYIYRCRGCDKWKPMEWELDEDSYDSHWCGGSPYCCPLKDRPAQQQVKRGQPKPVELPKAATHFQCAGCSQWYPIRQGHYLPDGRVVCGSYGCDPGPLTSQKAKEARDAMDRLQQTFICEGCNQRIPMNQAHRHPTTGYPYCGDRYCLDRISHFNMPKTAAKQYGPPRAG